MQGCSQEAQDIKRAITDFGLQKLGSHSNSSREIMVMTVKHTYHALTFKVEKNTTSTVKWTGATTIAMKIRLL